MHPADVDAIALPVEPVTPDTPCRHVYDRFFLDQRLTAVPVIKDEVPVGLVGRRGFMSGYRRSDCQTTGVPHAIAEHLRGEPPLVEATVPLEEIVERVIADAGRDLAEGLIVTRHGRYVGLAAPHLLLRALADRQERRAAPPPYRHPATGLASRALMEDRLSMAVAAAERARSRVAVLVLDLRTPDGEPPALEVVRAVAARLPAAVRRADTIAHLDQSQLGIILPGVTHADAAHQVARKVLEVTAAALMAGGMLRPPQPALGVALFPDDAASARRLLECAERAVEQAGRRVEHEGQADDALEPVSYATLRQALERRELTLVYQPQVDLASGRPCGVETLVRWTRAGGHVVPANQIIAVAESSGLMGPLAEWVLATACAQMRSWHAAGVLVVRLAVNLSGLQVRQPELPALVATTLAQSGLPAAALELELSETAMAAEGDELATVLGGLRALGVRVAVDDFGSGALALRHLARLPLDALKLDSAVTAGVASDAGCAAVARAAIALAHELGLTVIAEGVETLDQARWLRAHGCDVMQGYHFSLPLPPAEVAELVRSGRHLAL